MIPENISIVEKFILGELNGEELDNFLLKMKNSEDFASEVKLNQEIANSIIENDVMELRLNLHGICSNLQNEPANQNFFDFAQNSSIFSVQNQFSTDISSTENSLQKIHLETHLKSLNERTHQIHSQTDSDKEKILPNQINDFVLEEEIKDAILEKDVIDLRYNLFEIISKGYLSSTDFEIDQFRSKESPKEQIINLENIIKTNKSMANQLKLHEEIDMAIGERDIVILRNTIKDIINEEQQISFAEINRIDDYLLEYLDEKDRNEFEALIENNLKMKKETILQSEINEAIVESDIINLRTALHEIFNENKNTTKIRKFIPDTFRNKPLRIVGIAASAAAVISTGLFTLSQQKTTSESLFHQAYQPYDASGLFRSAPLSNPSFKGIELYNDRRFNEAIAQFAFVLKENSEHPMCNFYTGLCYLEKNSFNNAIASFQKVINEKDNLFIEQAQWYMALSLLKTNELKNAYAILNQIIESNGYYQKNAKELLKKIK
jgi:hypothetical protein